MTYTVQLPAERFVIEDQLKVGIYFLIKDGVAIYVGKSTNIINRVWAHRKSGIDFDEFAYIEAPLSRLDKLEAAYTAAMTPRLNCNPDGTAMNPELSLRIRHLPIGEAA